jgi:hypothetical protein
MGKGSRARPFEVDQDEFASAWERTFGKKDKEVKDIKEEKLEKTEEQDDSTKTK